MKTLVMLVLTLAFCCSNQIAAQTNKQVVQLHQVPSHITTVHLQLPSNKVEIIKTKSSRISIESTIKLSAGSVPLLDYLVSTGRYEFATQSSATSPTLILALSKSPKVLIIKGAVCKEVITYKVYVPERLLQVTTSYSSITASLSD